MSPNGNALANEGVADVDDEEDGDGADVAVVLGGDGDADGEEGEDGAGGADGGRISVEKQDGKARTESGDEEGGDELEGAEVALERPAEDEDGGAVDREVVEAGMHERVGDEAVGLGGDVRAVKDPGFRQRGAREVVGERAGLERRDEVDGDEEKNNAPGGWGISEQVTRWRHC